MTGSSHFSHCILCTEIYIFLAGVVPHVSYVAAVAVEILQSGVMLQASRQLWRPSSALLSSRIGRRTFSGNSCSSSIILLHSSGESTCISRIIIPLRSGWVQERPSAVPWIIREAHTGTAGKSHGQRKKGLNDSYLQYTKRGDALQTTSDVEDESDEMEEKASKGASKRRALRAKHWGAKLASLSSNQLRQAVRLAKLSEEVYDAVILVKSLGPKVRNGKRRQFNYIGGLLRDADPELMEQILKVCIDGETLGSSSASKALESSEDEFSDDNDDEKTDNLSEEDLSAQNMARRWIAGLLGGYQDVTYEVFSGPSDVYFDRQELRRLLRDVNQAQASLLSLQTADSGETENSRMSPLPLEAPMDSGHESMQTSLLLGASLLGDDEKDKKPADLGENEETQTLPSLETAGHEELKKDQKSPKQLKKAAKKAEIALFNFLFDLARKRMLDSEYLQA